MTEVPAAAEGSVDPAPEPANATEEPPEPAEATEVPPEPAEATEVPPEPAEATEVPPEPAEATEAPPEPAEATEAPPKARELNDPRELRAMTHPVRLSLLEVLGLHDALTATEAGELIGESATTCSFHLRQLAKYGFVEEAGDAPGRRRPWRLANRKIQFSSASGDAEMGAASVALENLLVQRWFDAFSKWQMTRAHYPKQWQEAAIAMETLTHLTPSELAEIQTAIIALFAPFEGRRADPSRRPPESRPVEFLGFAFPFVGEPT
jgi:predicted transcriptional regulator